MDSKLLKEKLVLYTEDINGIMERFLGDLNFYYKCLNNFLNDTGMDSLKEALDKRDYKNVFQNIHTLKGVSGNLGLTPLYKKACKMVEDLRHEDYSTLKIQYEEIALEIKKINDEFK